MSSYFSDGQRDSGRSSSRNGCCNNHSCLRPLANRSLLQTNCTVLSRDGLQSHANLQIRIDKDVMGAMYVILIEHPELFSWVVPRLNLTSFEGLRDDHHNFSICRYKYRRARCLHRSRALCHSRHGTHHHIKLKGKIDIITSTNIPWANLQYSSLTPSLQSGIAI